MSVGATLGPKQTEHEGRVPHAGELLFPKGMVSLPAGTEHLLKRGFVSIMQEVWSRGTMGGR